MREYLIATDDDDFLGPVRAERWADVLAPAGWVAVPAAGAGEYRIAVEGVEIEFDWEMPGLLVIVHGPLDESVVERMLATVARQVGAELGERTRLVPLQTVTTARRRTGSRCSPGRLRGRPPGRCRSASPRRTAPPDR
ncbi:MAG TPA: hypothetical protein VGG05_10490 [Pseudonocardiaceae bacterium]